MTSNNDRDNNSELNESEFQRYLVPLGQDEPARVSEVPSQMAEPVEKLPSGLAPMSRVELEGRAYQGMASGNTPWWVLVSGVVFLIGPVVVLLVAALIAADWLILAVTIPFLAVFTAIVWRGVSAKLTLQREKTERQARRQRAMRK